MGKMIHDKKEILENLKEKHDKRRDKALVMVERMYDWLENIRLEEDETDIFQKRTAIHLDPKGGLDINVRSEEKTKHTYFLIKNHRCLATYLNYEAGLVTLRSLRHDVDIGGGGKGYDLEMDFN